MLYTESNLASNNLSILASALNGSLNHHDQYHLQALTASLGTCTGPGSFHIANFDETLGASTTGIASGNGALVLLLRTDIHGLTGRLHEGSDHFLM